MGEAAVAHPQRLRRWIEMVKLERTYAAVVAADATPAPGLRHQGLFHLPTTPGHSLRAAALTAVKGPAPATKHGPPLATASPPPPEHPRAPPRPSHCAPLP